MRVVSVLSFVALMACGCLGSAPSDEAAMEYDSDAAGFETVDIDTTVEVSLQEQSFPLVTVFVNDPETIYSEAADQLLIGGRLQFDGSVRDVTGQDRAVRFALSCTQNAQGCTQPHAIIAETQGILPLTMEFEGIENRVGTALTLKGTVVGGPEDLAIHGLGSDTVSVQGAMHFAPVAESTADRALAKMPLMLTGYVGMCGPLVESGCGGLLYGLESPQAPGDAYRIAGNLTWDGPVVAAPEMQVRVSCDEPNRDSMLCEGLDRVFVAQGAQPLPVDFMLDGWPAGVRIRMEIRDWTVPDSALGLGTPSARSSYTFDGVLLFWEPDATSRG